MTDIEFENEVATPVPNYRGYFKGSHYNNGSEFDDIVKNDNFGEFMIHMNLDGLTRSQVLKDRQVWYLYKRGAVKILTNLMKIPTTNNKEKKFPYVKLAAWAFSEPKDTIFYKVMETYLSLPINDEVPLWKIAEKSDVFGRNNSAKPFSRLSVRASIRYVEFLHSLNPQVFKGFKGTWTDERDGKTYKTVTLNGKTWLSENFKYGKTNGVYDLDDIRSGCVVPEGWRIPMPEDWRSLSTSLRKSSHVKDDGSNEYEDFDSGEGNGSWYYSEGDFHTVMDKESWKNCIYAEGDFDEEGDLIGFGIKPTHKCDRFHGLDCALYWTDLKSSGIKDSTELKLEGVCITDYIFKHFDVADNKYQLVETLKGTNVPHGPLSLGCIRLVKDEPNQ